jgi:hypothetical protein
MGIFNQWNHQDVKMLQSETRKQSIYLQQFSNRRSASHGSTVQIGTGFTYVCGTTAVLKQGTPEAPTM